MPGNFRCHIRLGKNSIGQTPGLTERRDPTPTSKHTLAIPEFLDLCGRDPGTSLKM